jgi:zinc/manganese transport system substrate-binding protein
VVTEGITRRRGGAHVLPVAAAVLLLAAVLGGCASTAASAGSAGVINVVAAENFWGSIAAQLGGAKVHVISIVSDPNTDPHEYESSPADARELAGAEYVILNGAGYDDWADKLLSAQPESGRRVLTVATLLGKKDGDNPHFWYNPAYVFAVMSRITADYKAIDPGEASYFSSQYAFVQQAFAPYRERLAYVRQHFAGEQVAATESIFQYMAQYLHLDLVTPYPFMEAVAEGNDPPAQSEATFVNQIQAKAFRVLVYNVQTVTPLTTTMKEQTAAQDIPVIGVSETIQPPIATFQDWMDGELDSLINALNANALGQ